MITLDWKNNLRFDAATPSGHTMSFDGLPSDGHASAGPSPMETLLAAAAACSAMDVVSILAKKKQVVESYRIEVDGVRTEEGVWPRPFASMSIRHYLSGENLDRDAVARAVELSDEKYCSVVATLRASPKVESTWTIE